MNLTKLQITARASILKRHPYTPPLDLHPGTERGAEICIDNCMNEHWIHNAGLRLHIFMFALSVSLEQSGQWLFGHIPWQAPWCQQDWSPATLCEFPECPRELRTTDGGDVHTGSRTDAGSCCTAMPTGSGNTCTTQLVHFCTLNNSDLTESFEEINPTRCHGVVMDSRRSTTITATKLILTNIHLIAY